MTTSPPAQQDVPQAIEQAFSLAIAHHQQGHTQQADELYRAILQLDPRHAAANHNLGLLAMQAKQTDIALGYFNTALDADPGQGQFWLSYIDALAQTGQEDTARQVLALAEQQGLQGEAVDGLKSRLGMAAGKVKQKAAPAAQKAAAPDAKEIAELEDLYKKGRYADAVRLAQSLTQRFPQHWAGWKMLGVVYSQLGGSAEALQPMQKAAELRPNDAEAHNNLGITLGDLGRHAEAVASFRRAVKLKPGYVTAHSNLGAALHKLGRFKEAETSCRQALKLDPRYADALGNLGGVLNDMGRAQEAENTCRKALTIDPDGYAANNNLGLALKSQGRLEEAEMSCLRAISLRPDLVETHANMGGILHEQGRLLDAAESFRRVLDKRPDDAVAWSNLLFCLAQSTGVSADELFGEHRRYGEHFEAKLRGSERGFANSKDAERKLRVGFVSGDLRKHVVATFFEPLLEGLAAQSQLELHAYYNHIIDDEVSKRLRGRFAHWHPVVTLNDDELADKIRADGIDILIDLSGHTAHNRLLTFARKPAPVQASWIGYPCTTGLQAMDYYLTDAGLVPRGAMERQFTEKIVHLPASVPFLPSDEAPGVGDLPALHNGHITFASFNRLSKLNEQVVALWAQLLLALPDSKMLLAGMPLAGGEEQLVTWFARQGVARERLVFKQRCSMKEYLELHRQADINLDTWPYSGGTTTLNALWMGVPTLTLAADMPAARSSASILGNVGLGELIATDEAQFKQKGLTLAGDLKALAALRAGARQRMNDSPMLQPDLLAAGLAQALRIMWRGWCAGETPQGFEVSRQQASAAMQEAAK
jgi:predicted O-linked N-acetylglucosamine transferase (SPINDLY family)